MKNYLSLLFRRSALFVGIFTIAVTAVVSVSAAPIRVLVWDERQPLQKTAYAGAFLGDTIAAYLTKQAGLEVKSTGLNEPKQGLSDDALDHADVLVWWGHQRHGEVTDEHVAAILRRIKAGKLSLVAIHSAHWSKPFIAAMSDRAVADALKSVPESERATIKVVRIPAPGGLPKPDAPVTPSFKRVKGVDGADTLEVTMPGCIFPVVTDLGTPGHLTTKLPEHPIAKGIPATFDVPQTEIYGGTFHVPKPDAVVFEERWDDGETFTSGCAWTVGKGRVFYFRPGHEAYPIYTQEVPLKIIENAIRWGAEKP